MLFVVCLLCMFLQKCAYTSADAWGWDMTPWHLDTVYPVHTQDVDCLLCLLCVLCLLCLLCLLCMLCLLCVLCLL